MLSTVYLGTTTGTCDESKAKLFNFYFHSVFNKEFQPIPECDIIEQSHDFLSSFTITEADVIKALTQLDTSKAVGIDGIGPRILKHCATPLHSLLCHLFNLNLRTGFLL